MKSNIKITFWLNSAKTNKKRFAPIYVRVTDGKDFFTMTTGQYIKPSDWYKKTMRLKGTSEETVTINEYLDAFKNKIQRIASQLILGNNSFKVFTPLPSFPAKIFDPFATNASISVPSMPLFTAVHEEPLFVDKNKSPSVPAKMFDPLTVIASTDRFVKPLFTAVHEEPLFDDKKTPLPVVPAHIYRNAKVFGCQGVKTMPLNIN